MENFNTQKLPNVEVPKTANGGATDFFDEKSDKWIKALKVYTIVLFYLYITAGVVCCIGTWVDWWIYITDIPFLNGIICLAAGFFLAFFQLCFKMLIIQLLNNIQIIRKKAENDYIKNTTTEESFDLPEL